MYCNQSQFMRERTAIGQRMTNRNTENNTNYWRERHGKDLQQADKERTAEPILTFNIIL